MGYGGGICSSQVTSNSTWMSSRGQQRLIRAEKCMESRNGVGTRTLMPASRSAPMEIPKAERRSEPYRLREPLNWIGS